MKHLTLGALLLASAGLAAAQTSIDVRMVDGQLQVSQAQVQRALGQPGIQWVMRTEGYHFPPDGVRISPSGEHRCTVLDQKRVFRCEKVAKASSKQYSYVVRVVDTPTLKVIQPPQPDLWIQDE
jgi:hypothetical protein